MPLFGKPHPLDQEAILTLVILTGIVALINLIQRIRKRSK